MISFHDKKKGWLIIGAFAVLFLVASLPGVSLKKALAAESEAERTAKLVEGAKKEGKLLWYLSLSIGEGTKLLSSFREKYPFIETALYRSGDETVLTKIISEARAKRYLFYREILMKK